MPTTQAHPTKQVTTQHKDPKLKICSVTHGHTLYHTELYHKADLSYSMQSGPTTQTQAPRHLDMSLITQHVLTTPGHTQ